ncbi:MAG: FAD-dependent oxidoreductase [Candidatus Jordarchaeaceae archaeon]
MRDTYDVIVIGGGPSGLATAGLLAKEGFQTLVIEKSEALGGRLRGIKYNGLHFNLGLRIFHGAHKTPEDSYIGQTLRALGVKIKFKEIPWCLAFAGKRSPDGKLMPLQSAPVNRERGLEAFFDFFSALGLRLNEEAKEELRRIFGIFGKMSDEELDKALSISLDEWVQSNVKEPLAQAFFYGCGSLTNIPINEISLGYIADTFSDLQKLGKSYVFFYPVGGPLEETLIPKLAQAVQNYGAEILTNHTVRRVIIEDDEVRGTWVMDNRSRLYHEFEAPIVVCAFPMFQAAGSILDESIFPSEWLETLKRMRAWSHDDYQGVYLLKKQVIPDDAPQFAELFELTDIPTFVGEYGVASSVFGVKVPKGKQLVYGFAGGPLLGFNPTPQKVRELHERFKSVLDKGFPGFIEAIEWEGYTLGPGNWGRYYMVTVPSGLGYKSPTIKGLYFTGDTSRVRGGILSDKAFGCAMRCAEIITKENKGTI